MNLLVIANLVLTLWAYAYLIHIQYTECTCAITPEYYTIVAFTIYSLVYMFVKADVPQNVRNVLALGYLFLSISFIVSVFIYTKRVEGCDCKGESGPVVLQMLQWLRILVVAVILISLAVFLFLVR